MKKNIIILFVLSILGIVSCTKNKDTFIIKGTIVENCDMQPLKNYSLTLNVGADIIKKK